MNTGMILTKTSNSILEQQVKELLDKNNVEYKSKFILINNSEFLGDKVEVSISDDGKWVCLPVRDEEGSNFFGTYVYKPKVFKIDSEYEAYLKQGTMIVLTNIKLLRE